MRLSELLGTEVHDQVGTRVGRVADVMVLRDGPLDENGRPGFRILGLVVVEGRHGRLLGYEKERHPAAFRWAVRRMAKQIVDVPWEQVRSVTPNLVTIGVDAALLEAHEH
jgi:sporulation protein YlmC with PRC-barrel domain